MTRGISPSSCRWGWRGDGHHRHRRLLQHWLGRYYTFTLTEASEVTITLESSEADPYLYLREGEAKSGDAVQENDDIAPGTDTNSRIQETLVAGTYTIEATTYGVGEMGSFTLTVSGS